MTSLSTTYLIPAILLNPAFILHLINTFVSHLMPSTHTISHSPHAFIETLGPVPGTAPYLDMHADDQLCWRYTAIMVIVQVLAFGRVQDNRDAKKTAKAAKIERERARKEKKEKKEEERLLQQATKIAKANGHAATLDSSTADVPNGNGVAKEIIETESEDSSSVTTTSEEEMIL